jgi:hypothetical protein
MCVGNHVLKPAREIGDHVADRPSNETQSGWRAHPVRTAFIVVAIVALLAIAGFVVWALTPYRADDAALEAMASGRGVTVTEEAEGIVFAPDGDPSVGLVLYPGGRVEASAYAPLARAVAEQGYLVIIQPMPLNLAVFGIGSADDAFGAHPDIAAWAVGGHSLGGAMAAEFTAREPGRISALVLLAAYPASSDLSGEDFSALTMRGSEDGLVSVDEIEEGQLKLPPGSAFSEIDGGNHAGFGSYGEQSGDGPSALPPGAQAEIAAEAIGELLAAISE